MKRILFVCALVFMCVVAPMLAQNISTTQMQLVSSTVFTNRLQYLMVQQAQTVISEAPSDTVNADTFARYSTTCHVLRYGYAIQVIGSPAVMASFASVLISGANFPGGVIVGTVTGSGTTADSTANDAALAKAITDSWNTLSRCVTNP